MNTIATIKPTKPARRYRRRGWFATCLRCGEWYHVSWPCCPHCEWDAAAKAAAAKAAAGGR